MVLHPEIFNFTLPFPPSNNTYYRNVGRKAIKSVKARSYLKSVAEVLLCQETPKKSISGLLGVAAIYSPPDKRKRDMDNYSKGLYDSLENLGIIENDCNFRLKLEWWSNPVKYGQVLISIMPLDVMEEKFNEIYIHMGSTKNEINFTNSTK